MDEEKLGQLNARLRELHEEENSSIAEFSDAIKKARDARWDPKLVAKAKDRLKKAAKPHGQIQGLLREAEEYLISQGLSPELVRSSPSKSGGLPDRYWKVDLTRNSVPPHSASIEECIQNGIDDLLKNIPREWWQDQQALRDQMPRNVLLDPLVLYGGARQCAAPDQVHRYAYGLMLALDVLNGRLEYDMYGGASLVSSVCSLCRVVDSLKKVAGGIDKLRELPLAPDAEVDSRIYELLVGARAALLGRNVEFLKPTQAPTPDLRINDFAVPAVIECKRQGRLSAYEKREVQRISEVFGHLCEDRLSLGLVGTLCLEFRLPVDRVEVTDVMRTVMTCVSTVSGFGQQESSWGTASFTPVDVSKKLQKTTRLYSPEFLESVFGWSQENSDWDGICAVVQNSNSNLVDRAELPFSLKWRVDDQQSIDRKARSIVGLMKEAVEQVPPGDIGFIYIAFEDTLRPAVADRRTERILELAKTFWFKWGWGLPVRMVVNRVYPMALAEGRPDVIESSIVITFEDDDDMFAGDVPTCVYTEGGA